MVTFFPIILGLIIVGSFAACYFCKDLWHWWQILLAETVLLLGLGFLVLAGEVFRIQQHYGKQNANNLKKIVELEPLVNALEFGTSDSRTIGMLENRYEVPIRLADGEVDENGEPIESGRMLSVRDLDHQLSMVSRARGRVWRNATITSTQPVITLAITDPDPHNIQPGAILYAFQQGEPSAVNAQVPGPGYVGEFRVSGVAPQQVQLEPAMQLDQLAMARISQKQRPWVLYENTPADQYPDDRLEIFAEATPEFLKQMIPPQSVDEYLRHGTPAQAGDDQWHRNGYDEEGKLVDPRNWNASAVTFKYRRSLRDYNLLYQNYSKVFTQMGVDKLSLEADKKQLQKTLDSAQELQAAYKKEGGQLRSDVAGVTRDGEAIEAHRKQVATQLANALALLEDVIKENTQFARSME